MTKSGKGITTDEIKIRIFNMINIHPDLRSKEIAEILTWLLVKKKHLEEFVESYERLDEVVVERIEQILVEVRRAYWTPQSTDGKDTRVIVDEHLLPSVKLLLDLLKFMKGKVEVEDD